VSFSNDLQGKKLLFKQTKLVVYIVKKVRIIRIPNLRQASGFADKNWLVEH